MSKITVKCVGTAGSVVHVVLSSAFKAIDEPVGEGDYYRIRKLFEWNRISHHLAIGNGNHDDALGADKSDLSIVDSNSMMPGHDLEPACLPYDNLRADGRADITIEFVKSLVDIVDKHSSDAYDVHGDITLDSNVLVEEFRA